jgi:hypothetical protein
MRGIQMKANIQISVNELIAIAQKRLERLNDSNSARVIENAHALYNVYAVLVEIERALTPNETEKIEKFKKELVEPCYLKEKVK